MDTPRPDDRAAPSASPRGDLRELRKELARLRVSEECQRRDAAWLQGALQSHERDLLQADLGWRELRSALPEHGDSLLAVERWRARLQRRAADLEEELLEREGELARLRVTRTILEARIGDLEEEPPFMAERPQDASRAEPPFMAERPQDSSGAECARLVWRYAEPPAPRGRARPWEALDDDPELCGIAEDLIRSLETSGELERAQGSGVTPLEAIGGVGDAEVISIEMDELDELGLDEATLRGTGTIPGRDFTRGDGSARGEAPGEGEGEVISFESLLLDTQRDADDPDAITARRSKVPPPVPALPGRSPAAPRSARPTAGAVARDPVVDAAWDSALAAWARTDAEERARRAAEARRLDRLRQELAETRATMESCLKRLAVLEAELLPGPEPVRPQGEATFKGLLDEHELDADQVTPQRWVPTEMLDVLRRRRLARRGRALG